MPGADTAPDIGRIIRTEACIAEGVAFLASADPRLVPALEVCGPIPLRLRPDGFSALLSAIVSQQVSVASAAAIWARVETAGLVTVQAVSTATDEELRACGLSRPKVRYARALTCAGIDYPALRHAPTPQVVQTLVAVPGIGLWTAEVYAMLALGRADVLAAGDLALQESARMLFSLETRPSEAELRAMAKAWSPWRAVAARILWAYFRAMKQREGIGGPETA